MTAPAEISTRPSRHGVDRGVAIEGALLALVLGFASVLPTSWALQLHPIDGIAIQELGWHPMGSTQALLLALGSVLPAAIAGGLAGVVAWSRRPTLAPLAAVAVAWATGIVLLPAIAAALDVPLRLGISCLDGCRAEITDEASLSGLRAYLLTPLASIPLVVGWAGSGLALVVARIIGRPLVWAVALVVVHGGIHAASLLGAGGPIYAMLIAGVSLWSGWLWLRTSPHRVRFAAPPWTLVLGPSIVVALGSIALSETWVPPVPRDPDVAALGTVQRPAIPAPGGRDLDRVSPGQLGAPGHRAGELRRVRQHQRGLAGDRGRWPVSDDARRSPLPRRPDAGHAVRRG